MELFYKRSGDGPPLVMLHGLFGSLENLGAIARLLQDRFTLYQIDLRNHGRSPHANSMGFAEMADDVAAVMEREGLASTHVLGHSLGGKVAMQMALDHPQRVKGLVVLDIAPVSYPPGHNEILHALNEIDPAGYTTRAELDTRLQQYVDEPGVRQFILKNLNRDQQGRFYWRLNVPAISHWYDDLRAAIGDGLIREAPTLFVRGEKSRYIQLRNHKEILQKFPHADIVTIDGASHWLHAEKPKEVAEVVIRYLQKSY